MTPHSSDIGLEDLTFYYDEMLRGNLAELEVETAQGKIVLKRAGAGREGPLHSSSGQVFRRRKTDHEFKEEAVPSAPFAGKVVSSPIMGIFYRSSSPQSPPFAKEGETVNAGDTLCIIEAMKVMNEIKAESRCKVLKILGENGKPVTKGQALFQVELL